MSKIPKRKQVRKACSSCASAHAACDDQRPCGRCTKRNLTCTDLPRKKRKTSFKTVSRKPEEEYKLGKDEIEPTGMFGIFLLPPGPSEENSIPEKSPVQLPSFRSLMDLQEEPKVTHLETPYNRETSSSRLHKIDLKNLLNEPCNSDMGGFYQSLYPLETSFNYLPQNFSIQLPPIVEHTREETSEESSSDRAFLPFKKMKLKKREKDYM